MSSRERLRAWGPSVAMAAALTVVLAAGAALHVRSQASQIRAEARERLAAVANLERRLVVSWRSERLGDASRAASGLAGAVALGRLARPSGDAASRARLEARLGGILTTGSYRSASVLGADGRVLAAAGEPLAPTPLARETAARTVRDGAAHLSDVELVAGGPVLHLAARIGGAPATLLLELSAPESLFKLVEGWPIPSASGEVFVLRADANGATFLTERRHRPGHVLENLPLTPKMAAILPSLFRGNVVELRDYRGVRSLAVSRGIDGSSWRVVAKLDVAEVEAPVAALARSAALAAGGSALGLVIAIVLWTWRRAAEARARAFEAERVLLERKLQLIGRYGNDAVLVHEHSGEIVEANDRALTLLGVARRELLGRFMRDFLAPDEVAAHLENLSRPLGSEGLRVERRLRRCDGTTFLAEMSVQPFDMDGRVLRHAILRDVTEHRHALEALRESEAQFRLLATRAPIGMFQTDAAGRLTYVNDALPAMCGLTPEEYLARDWRSTLHPDDAERVLEVVARAMQGGPSFTGEYRLRAPDGRVTWVYGAAQRLHDAAGALLGTVGVVLDISEQKALQARLGESERLAAIGTLATGAAHALNSPLAAAIADTAFAREESAQAGADPDVLAALDDAIAADRRAAGIVKNLQTFARGTGAARGLVDPVEAASAASELLAHDLLHRARFEVSLSPTPFVLANRNEIVQCVVNLLMNALEALPEGPSVQHEVRLSTRTTPAGDAVIEVQDDGRGIPPDLRARIFDPFFTTRTDHGGTGLGLSVVHGVAAAAGGRVEVDSAEGRGSTFRIVLPGVAARPAPAPAAPCGCRSRILVVDDDELVVRAVTRLLAARHDVVGVGSGAEALARLEAERFDAVVCDLMMPGMSGMELQETLLARGHPAAARTLFMTGGAFTTRAQDFLESCGRPALAKPFTPDELTSALDGTLARGPPAPPRASRGTCGKR